MVDSISLHLDSSLGIGDAFADRIAEKMATAHLDVRQCTSWFFVWNLVRTGAGIDIWTEF